MVEQLNVYEFIEKWHNLEGPRDQFLTQIIITSKYYHLELNGIHINNVRLIRDNCLEIVAWNSRRNRLLITDDLRFELKH